MTIIMSEEYELPLDINYKEVAENVINAALDYENCPYEAEVSMTLTNNEGIHAINKEFREIDRPTDVLSFPLVNYDVPGQFDFLEDCDDCFNPESGELMLGDIIISLDKVKEQADSYGHSNLREYAFLIAHSMLHLMGYDHMTESDASDMKRRQEAILQLLNITREV